ncbi:hypothetical protein G6F63_015843 [Rhizopus arrhizus]|nr:hypothetical protein G6F63_015843 [Rhizopus arrhizus]
MINWPNAAGRAIFMAESAATRRRSIAVNARPSSDAEVQCTQAHQVAADAEAVHADHREQERQRNHQRGDRRRTQVAQQQEQHHHHQ